MIALVCMTYNVYHLQSQVATLQAEAMKSHDAVLNEMTKIRDMSAIMASSNRRTLKSIREELDAAKADVAASAGQSRQEALQKVQSLARELKVEEQRQREMHEQVKSQMADAAVSADAKLNDVKNEVGSVKSEVGTVKNEVVQTQKSLNRAVSDLKRTMGDMGVMSGLIATNQRELEVLKALGDRNYTEFRIRKTKDPQVVAGVGLVLRKADPGSKRFTLEVAAEDARVQKKDRTINEPVQFYVAKRKQPYEIVINSVSKNEVAGYLATPKLDQDRP